MIRVGILLPWGIVFAFCYVQLLEARIAETQQTVALLGVVLAIASMVGAYFTGCIHASVRRPIWTNAFLYWVELAENQLSDNECSLLVPAIEYAADIAREGNYLKRGRAAACERITRRGIAENNRVKREYLRGELLRLAHQIQALTSEYMKECGETPSVSALHRASEGAISALKTD